ncbi:MAG: MotA/TolQ/ExbB proton channel family protein, partial [Bacteroidales bacterium]|nr:MotA/TolQ/ExbB proton channel family protein [Bacteroidales bacterium]
MEILTILQVITTETTELASTGTNEETFITLAMKGGWVMLPSILLSIVAVYIFFERYFAINKAKNI